MEIWKDIDKYNGDYQINNLGKVKSFKIKKEKILKQKKDKYGYFFIDLYKNGKCETKRIHVLLFETFNNYKLKKDECIHHIDENKENNNLNNLKLMTISEHHSLHSSGENHPMFRKHHSEKTKKLIRKNNPTTKLTENDIIKIWRYLDEGILTQKKIAKLFKVDQSTISKIRKGKIWQKDCSHLM